MFLEKKVKSSDGIHTLSGRVYLPKETPKGYFHVVHGMTEHIGRYDSFMQKIADAGFICFGYDNLGHGKTAENESELGFIAHKNGWKYLCKDVRVFSDEVKKEYGEMPYILLGHSMGSFIVRLASVTTVKPDKLIAMGTGGPNPASGAGLALIGSVKLFKGEKSISPLIEKAAFGAYNKHFGDGNKYLWLTKNEDVLREYCSDPFCAFHFTASAMGDLVKLNYVVNKSRWFKEVNEKMPVLLVSGAMDPVGNYGKGVKAVYEKLKKNGKNAEIKLYDDCRHEILNETCREAVISDITEFILK